MYYQQGTLKLHVDVPSPALNQLTLPSTPFRLTLRQKELLQYCKFSLDVGGLNFLQKI